VQWFGEDWGAPVCRAADHVDTPVDLECAYCGRLIDEGDAGFVMPWLPGDGDVSIMVTHVHCLLQAVLPAGLVPPV